MKALFLKQHGSLDEVSYGDLPLPECDSDEVLLRVEAAALNRLDLWVIEGWPALRLDFPHVLGCDGAGIVEAVGADVDGFSPGDHVVVNPTRSCQRCEFCLAGRENLCLDFAIFGEHLPGFFAQFQAVPARNLLKVPHQFPLEEAAAAALVMVTAWHSLVFRGQIQAGESVLVIGAAGGANSAYIQIARLAGADKIYVVGSSDEKLEHARSLGADLTFNRNEVDWSKEVFLASGRSGVDIVIDNVGAATFGRSLRALRKGGRLLTVGNSSGPMVEIDNRLLFARHLSVIGSSMGTPVDFAEVMALVFAGRLRGNIGAELPLSEGRLGLQMLERGEALGKIVLRPW